MVAKVRWGVAAALVIAAVFAGWAGWSWLDTARDPDLALASTRDEALQAGRLHVSELTTLDYHDVDAGIGRWLAVSTGALHEQLAGTDGPTRESLRQGQTVATGSVLDAAVSELDGRAGLAKLLVSVEITTTKEGTAPATKRNRFAVALKRMDGGWKVSALDQVPVGTQ